MRILITGADGFVGSHLVKALGEGGLTEVFGIAHRPTGTVSPHYTELAVDLTAPDFVANLPAGVDTVLHLAQSLGYRNFPSSADDLFAVNVGSSARLLEWARTTGVRRFVFASTGNVYRPSVVPLKETDPCDPVSFYGATKLAAELLIGQYSRFFETTILRIFGVYGPGQRSMIVPDMISRIRAATEITLGQGLGLVSSPLFITDCVHILSKMIAQTGSRESAIYNLGGMEPVDLKFIVEVLGRHLGATPRVTKTDAPASYLLGDSSKLYAKFGFRPHVQMERGLELTVRALD